MNIAEMFEAGALGRLNSLLKEKDKRIVVSGAIAAAFAQTRKKSLPDIADRINKLTEHIDTLIENMTLEFSKGRLVVKVSGPSDTLFQQLKLGSTWHDPVKDIEQVIIAGILLSAKRT